MGHLEKPVTVRDCNGNEFQCSRNQWEALYRPRRWTLVRDESGRRRRQRRSALRLWLARWDWLMIAGTVACVLAMVGIVVLMWVAPEVGAMILMSIVLVISLVLLAFTLLGWLLDL